MPEEIAKHPEGLHMVHYLVFHWNNELQRWCICWEDLLDCSDKKSGFHSVPWTNHASAVKWIQERKKLFPDAKYIIRTDVLDYPQDTPYKNYL